MVTKMGDMERVPSRLLFLCVLFVGYTRSAVQQADVQNSLFEAAFQGKCGRGSPCEQLCYELHDGMFECDCRPGYELHRNGYSCLEMNTTESNAVGWHGDALPLGGGDRDEDVLYQKDASFSAELAPVPPPPLPSAPAVSFVGDAAPLQPGIAGPTSAAPSTPAPTTAPPCTLDCGSGGTCVQPAEGQRCQCPLGRGGPRCETEVEHPDGAAETGTKPHNLVVTWADTGYRAPGGPRQPPSSMESSRSLHRVRFVDHHPPAGLEGARSQQFPHSGSTLSARGSSSSGLRRPAMSPMVMCVAECCSLFACYLVVIVAAIVLTVVLL